MSRRICKFAAGCSFVILSLVVKAEPIDVPYEDAGRKTYENGKYGYKDKLGNWLIPPQWNDVRNFKDGYAIVQKFEGSGPYVEKSKLGVYNKAGEMVIAAEWDGILGFPNFRGFVDGLAVVRKEGKCYFIDKLGKVVKKTQWNDISEFRDGLARVSRRPGNVAKVDTRFMSSHLKERLKNNVRYGFVDTAGNVAIKAKYLNAHEHLTDGVAAVQQVESKKWGLINQAGEEIRAFKWQLIEPFSEGLAAVYSDSQGVGYINIKGELAFSIQAARLGKFTCGLASFLQNGKWGVISETGEQVLAPKWDKVEINNSTEGFIQLTKGKLVGLASLDGHVVVEPRWESVSALPHETGFDWHYTKPRKSEGFSVSSNPTGKWNSSKYGYLDTNGEVVIEPIWSDKIRFFEGRAGVFQKKGKKREAGYIDVEGKIVIPLAWERAWEFKGGLAPVRKNGLWGYIDREGALIHKPQWSEARAFSEGFAVVKKGRKVGVINKRGDLIVECIWEEIEDFSNGLARVQKGKLYGFIDTMGNVVVPVEWPYAESYKNGEARVSKGGDWKQINTKGEVIADE